MQRVSARDIDERAVARGPCQFWGQILGQPLAQFASRAPREGDGQDLFGRNAMERIGRCQEPRGASDKGACFSRAGAGHNEHRVRPGVNGALLIRGVGEDRIA